jgi:syntaxin-binding protein 5
VSDTGFLAVSYVEKSLCVVDLRGPDMILREGFAEEGEKSKKGEASVAQSLTWSICAIGTDPSVGLRLFVGYQKGLSKIYSFVHGLAGWEVAKKPITFTHEALVNPLSSFVIDAQSGEELRPNASRLQG